MVSCIFLDATDAENIYEAAEDVRNDLTSFINEFAYESENDGPVVIFEPMRPSGQNRLLFNRYTGEVMPLTLSLWGELELNITQDEPYTAREIHIDPIAQTIKLYNSGLDGAAYDDDADTPHDHFTDSLSNHKPLVEMDFGNLEAFKLALVKDAIQNLRAFEKGYSNMDEAAREQISLSCEVLANIGEDILDQMQVDFAKFTQERK